MTNYFIKKSDSFFTIVKVVTIVNRESWENDKLLCCFKGFYLYMQQQSHVLVVLNCVHVKSITTYILLTGYCIKT